MLFSQRCWPEELFDVVCTDCPIPEFWISMHRSDGIKPYNGDGKFVVTGFIAGEYTQALEGLEDEQIIGVFLHQLKDIFGTILIVSIRFSYLNHVNYRMM